MSLGKHSLAIKGGAHIMGDVGQHSAVGDLTSPDNCIQYIRLPSASFTGCDAVLLLPGYGLQGQASELQLRHQRLLSIAVLHLRSLIGRLSHILVSTSDQSNKGEFRSQIFSPNTLNLLI